MAHSPADLKEKKPSVTYPQGWASPEIPSIRWVRNSLFSLSSPSMRFHALTWNVVFAHCCNIYLVMTFTVMYIFTCCNYLYVTEEIFISKTHICLSQTTFIFIIIVIIVFKEKSSFLWVISHYAFKNAKYIFLSLCYLTQNNFPQFHLFTCKCHNFILLYR